MKIRTMLIAGFVAVAVLTGVTGFYGWYGTTTIKAEADQAMFLADTRNMLKDRENDHYRWAMAIEELFLSNKKNLAVELDHTQCALGKFLYGGQLANLRDRLPAVAAGIDKIKTPHQHLHNSAQKIDERLTEIKNESISARKAALAIFKNETLPAMDEVQTGIKAVADLTEGLELEIENQQEAHFLRQKVVTLGVVCLAIFLALALGLGISRYIISAIHKVMDFAGRLSQGDVSVRLDMAKSGEGQSGANEIQEMATALNALADELAAKAEVAAAIGNGELNQAVRVVTDKDTLGQALQNMTTSLNRMITEITQAAEQVNISAGHIADSSQSLSQGATEQAASVEEISSSMEQIGSQSRTNADNAGQASQIAAQARDSGATSIKRMDEMTASMQAIDGSSKEIQKIIKVIDDIAFQTNLLALNAAVEAARAGKHGQGFAVVAQEVRSLAERSAKAAQETEGLIDDALQRVTTGNGIVENVASALTEMNEQVVKISDILQEISAASKEQAQGISQINDGIGQVDAVTQQNTANAEETAASAEELSGQAAHVRNTLARFKLKKEEQVPAITAGTK